MDTESITPPSRTFSALAGIVVAFTALALAELAAATSRTVRSPILDVGDRVIDLAPSQVKDFAISTFGTSDKLALLIGIAVVLLGYAAIVGILAFRHTLWVGIVGISLFGLLGVVSAIAGGRGAAAALPSVIGTIGGGLLLVFLHRMWFAPRDEATQPSDVKRRTLIWIGAAGLGAAMVGGTGILLSRRFDVSGSISSTILPRVPNPLAAVPTGATANIPGVASFVTPNASFYRIDTALSVPQIPADTYKLRIHGLVDEELVLSYEDLRRRTQVESDITLTCVSNEVGGRLIGNARWQGVRLDDLLREAGIDPSANQVVGRSYDDYTCGFPVDVAMDGRDALVAIGMNGEPLPAEHGFPARLIVPGLYGYVSATKWLSEIELTTFDAFDQYWVRRDWDALAPIKTQSRIDTPMAFNEIASGTAMIGGVAWAQTRGIEKVEVSVDEGPWQTADLADEATNTTWRQWSMPWTVTPGRHSITCRATDSTGVTQTEERTRPKPNGASGWHSVVVTGTST